MLCISGVAAAQLRRVETFYDVAKKQVKEIYFVKNTAKPVIDGLYISYYLNGKEKSKGNFIAGQQTGEWIYYYDNGNPKTSGVYRNNQRTGNWKYFSENGKLSSEGNLINGIRNGNWVFYYDNEEKKSEGGFINNKKNGLWQYFFEDGTPKAQAEFKEDVGYYKEFDHRGKLIMEGWNINGQSDSTWRYYYESGQVKATGVEKNGTRNGFWKLYHENGKLAAEGNYKDGIQDGNWTYYHNNGNKSAEGIEKNGQKEGSWKLYYPSGSFRAEGKFSGGSGIYREFYESGKLKVQGFLQKGVNQGVWRYYYEDGILEGEADFKDGEGLFKGYYPDGILKMQGFIKNGKRTGTWEIFKPDGKTAGFVKHYHDESEEENFTLPEIDEIDSVSVPVDTASRVVVTRPQPKGDNGKTRKPAHRWRYFTPKINEFRSLILGLNPAGLFLNQFPVSAEYYFRERLGYELYFMVLKDPFFRTDKTLPYNTLYSRGYSIGFRQKFYNFDTETGMFYFGHELRFTNKDWGSNFYDNINFVVLGANEKKYEYSLLMGNRWMPYAGGHGFTFDIFGGIGAGYRTYTEDFPYNPSYELIFERINKHNFVLSPRLGVTLGYAF